MFTRTISALIGAPLLLGLTYLGGSATAFLVTVLTVIALQEFLTIGEHMGIRAWRKLTLIIAVFWLSGLFLVGEEWMIPALVLWLLVGFGRLAMTYPKTSFSETGYNILAVLYTVVLLSHLYLLRQIPGGIEWTFLSFFLVWATDTGAYLIGRQFGSHPLAPNVSPKKTIEGAAGGLIFSILVALGFWYSIGGASWKLYVALAVVIGISGQIGDLFESALKRSAGVKDSGKLIPGHGGILDRFDSLVFALPLVYYIVIKLS